MCVFFLKNLKFVFTFTFRSTFRNIANIIRYFVKRTSLRLKHSWAVGASTVRIFACTAFLRQYDVLKQSRQTIPSLLKSFLER